MGVHEKKAEPPGDYGDLVKAIAGEIHSGRSDTPPGCPDIHIVEQRYTGSLHVTVIWDRWEGVDPEERGRVIVEAFEQERGKQQADRITMALGVTSEEAGRIGLDQDT